MAHYARVQDGIVTDVIVADQDFINTGVVGDPKMWIQTSYNTHGGVHYGPDGKPDGGVALRKNFAGYGFTYDSTLDAFIPPQPYSKWTLNTDTCLWDPPIPMPNDGEHYMWDDESGVWVLIPDPAPGTNTEQ